MLYRREGHKPLPYDAEAQLDPALFPARIDEKTSLPPYPTATELSIAPSSLPQAPLPAPAHLTYTPTVRVCPSV